MQPLPEQMVVRAEFLPPLLPLATPHAGPQLLRAAFPHLPFTVCQFIVALVLFPVFVLALPSPFQAL